MCDGDVNNDPLHITKITEIETLLIIIQKHVIDMFIKITQF